MDAAAPLLLPVADLSVTVRLPHADCAERAAAIRRVAKHCPVHETIATLSGIHIDVLDRTALAAAESTVLRGSLGLVAVYLDSFQFLRSGEMVD